MKALPGFALAAIAACTLSLALSSNAPDRPRGVSADRWAPISNTLGVVLVPDAPLGADMPLSPVGPGSMSPGEMGPGPSDPAYLSRMALIAPITPAVQAIIDEGRPVRGYIMVKRGKTWRPLAVVPPTVDN